MFQNPVQTTTGATSAGTVVPSASTSNLQAIQSLASGAAKITSLLFKPEDKTAAVQNDVAGLHQKYQQVLDHKGVSAAERWLSQEYSTKVAAYKTSAEKDAFTGSFKTMFGASPLEEERDRELALLEQKQKAELTRRTELTTTGREVVLGLGLNPDDVGEDKLIEYGEKAAAVQRSMAFKAQELSIAQQQGQLDTQQAKKTTDLLADGYLSMVNLNLDVGLQELSTKIQSDPAKAESLKTEYITRLAYLESRADADIQKSIRDQGGDPSNLDPSVVSSYKNRLKATRDFLNSQHILDKRKIQTDLFKQDAIVALRDADPVAYNAITLAPESAALFSANIQAGLSKAGAPESAKNTAKVLAEMVHGPATARVNNNSTSPAVYKVVGSVFDTADKMGADVKEQYRDFGAELVSKSLLESISPMKAVRSQANSNTGVYEAVKILKNRDFSSEEIQAIRTKVEDNGISLEDAMQGRLRTFINESLLPSLKATVFSDLERTPYSVQFKDGLVRLDVRANEELKPTPFRGLTNMSYRTRLKQMERVLNDEIQLYSKLTGGKPEDLAEVISKALGVSSAIDRLESQP